MTSPTPPERLPPPVGSSGSMPAGSVPPGAARPDGSVPPQAGPLNAGSPYAVPPGAERSGGGPAVAPQPGTAPGRFSAGAPTVGQEDQQPTRAGDEAAYSPPPGMTPSGKVQTTRSSVWWVGLIVAALLLIALLIFILQNSAEVTVHYLGARGQVSLAVALLLAAVSGLLLIAIPGSARIWQLRRALKKNASAIAPRRG